MISIADIQTLLGVTSDGIWGPKSQAALDAILHPSTDDGWNSGYASTFADPADVASYHHCIDQGHSEAYCLWHGDNGIGVWDDDTTGEIAMCALNSKHVIEKWGAVAAGKHKTVTVQIGDKTQDCQLADTGAPYDRVDLNPGAQSNFGIKPPALVKARWKWA